MPTCKCGKTVEDWRGARGHVQWTENGGHGDKGEVPDDWKSMFSDDDAGQDDVEDDDDQEAGQDDADDAGDDDANQVPVEAVERDSDESDAADGDAFGDRLRKAVTDDVRHLWGGA